MRIHGWSETHTVFVHNIFQLSGSFEEICENINLGS